MGQVVSHKTSLTNYQSTPRSIPKQWKPHSKLQVTHLGPFHEYPKTESPRTSLKIWLHLNPCTTSVKICPPSVAIKQLKNRHMEFVEFYTQGVQLKSATLLKVWLKSNYANVHYTWRRSWVCARVSSTTGAVIVGHLSKRKLYAINVNYTNDAHFMPLSMYLVLQVITLNQRNETKRNPM